GADELPSAARLAEDPARDFSRVPGGDQRARAPPGIEHAQEALDAAERQPPVPDAREIQAAVRRLANPRCADVIPPSGAPVRQIVGEDEAVELVDEDELVALEAAVELVAEQEARVVAVSPEVAVAHAHRREARQLELEARGLEGVGVVRAEVGPKVTERELLVLAQPL